MCRSGIAEAMLGVTGILAAIAVALVAAPLHAQPLKAKPMPDKAPARATIPWIDVHLHLVAGRGTSEDWVGAVDLAVQEMDRYGIAQAIVLPPPQVDSQPSVYDQEKYVDALRRHPGRFAFLGGGGALNPLIHRHSDPAKVSAQVKREFTAAAEEVLARGAAGFGEMASLHISAVPGHPYEFVPADHPLFLVLADIAARRDVPIDLHMDAVEGETPIPRPFAGGANPPRLPDTVGALERLLTHNRKARIVWAHGGSDPIGAMSAATIGRLMDRHPNLYVSLRIVGAQAPVMTNKVMAAGGLDPHWRDLLARHAERFLIGTDSFIVSPTMRGAGPGVTFGERNAPKLMATLHFLTLLPNDVARKIGRDNALRIYRLSAR